MIVQLIEMRQELDQLQQPGGGTMSGGKSVETPMSLDLTEMINRSNSGIRSAFEQEMNKPTPEIVYSLSDTNGPNITLN